MKAHEAHRHSVEVFGSKGQFQREGDLRHQPAGAGPGEQFRHELRGRGLGRQAAQGVAYVRGRSNGHRRREQKRRGARSAGRHSAAAAKGSDDGGPGHRDPRCGVGGYRSRGRKRKTVNLRRDFRLM